MGVEGERFERQNEEKATQDFILMSYPVMPLGTVELFHDAVYYSIKWSPVVFLSRLVLTGNFHILNELRKARQNPHLSAGHPILEHDSMISAAGSQCEILSRPYFAPEELSAGTTY